MNLESGVTLNAKLMGELSNIMPTIYLVHPMPAFEPSKHMGVWEIRITDDKGKIYAAKTHKLDKTDVMPYVENLKVSGNPLAPEVRWDGTSEYPRRVHRYVPCAFAERQRQSNISFRIS